MASWVASAQPGIPVILHAASSLPAYSFYLITRLAQGPLEKRLTTITHCSHNARRNFQTNMGLLENCCSHFFMWLRRSEAIVRLLLVGKKKIYSAGHLTIFSGHQWLFLLLFTMIWSFFFPKLTAKDSTKHPPLCRGPPSSTACKRKSLTAILSAGVHTPWAMPPWTALFLPLQF